MKRGFGKVSEMIGFYLVMSVTGVNRPNPGEEEQEEESIYDVSPYEISQAWHQFFISYCYQTKSHVILHFIKNLP
jgi:hypothetical protein